MYDELTYDNFILEIKQVIKEELSISNDVIYITNNLCDIIEKRLKNCDKSYDNTYNCNFANGDFIYKILDYDFSINYTCYYCSNNQQIKSLSENNKIFATSSFTDKNITINFIIIQGQIEEKSFYDSMQHEVEHMYQSIKKGELLIDDENDFRYKKIKYILANGTRNRFEYSIAICLYLSRSIEQDGFVNGLYNLLMKGNLQTIDEYLKQSDAYAYLYTLKLTINDLKNENDDDFYLALKNFSLTKETLFQIAEKGFKRFQIKIGKIYTRARNDMIKKNKLIPNDRKYQINTKINNKLNNK